MTTSIHDNNSNISAVDISYFNYSTRDLLKMLSTFRTGNHSLHKQRLQLNVHNDIPGISL